MNSPVRPPHTLKLRGVALHYSNTVHCPPELMNADLANNLNVWRAQGCAYSFVLHWSG